MSTSTKYTIFVIIILVIITGGYYWFSDRSTVGTKSEHFSLISQTKNETYNLRDDVSVYWTASTMPNEGYVMISLVDGPVSGWIGIAPVTANEHTWEIIDVRNDDIATRLVPGEYRVKITAYDKKPCFWEGCDWNAPSAKIIAEDISEGLITIR